MTTAYIGDTVALSLCLADEASGLFPQARVFSGPLALATVPLPNIVDGYYQANYVPPSIGHYTVIYDVYEDSGHTILSGAYDSTAEPLDVLPASGVVPPPPVPEEDAAVRQSFTLDATSNSIIVNSWLEISGTGIDSNVSNATLILYRNDGSILATPASALGPIIQGVFRFVIFPIPGLNLGETGAFSVATIDYAGPPLRTIRGVTGVTFSRSA